MVWRPYFEYSGKDTQIFAHMFMQHYSLPDFFDLKVHDDIILNHRLETDQAWNAFCDTLNRYFVQFKESHISNHLYFNAGDDFFYHK